MENTQWWGVKVPLRFVFDRSLPLTARAIYLTLLGHCAAWGGDECSLSTSSLMRLCGLGSRQSLRTHLDNLQSRGWLIGEKGRGPRRWRLVTPDGSLDAVPKLTIPGKLLSTRGVLPAAAWLYAFLLGQCEQQAGEIKLTLLELRALTAAGSDHTVRLLLEQLRQAGWLWSRNGGPGGTTYVPLDPHWAVREAKREAIKVDLEQATFKGESLMKQLLNIIVDSTEYQDNARPGFLVNPLTKQGLEFDRWYPGAGVALEFNGQQHYTTTEKFSDQDAVDQQRARDLIKDALARKHGTTIVTVRSTELTIAFLRDKLTGLLPVRSLSFVDPVVHFLHRYSLRYVRSVQHYA